MEDGSARSAPLSHMPNPATALADQDICSWGQVPVACIGLIDDNGPCPVRVTRGEIWSAEVMSPHCRVQTHARIFEQNDSACQQIWSHYRAPKPGNRNSPDSMCA